MTPGCTITVCRCCGESFSDERPQSMGSLASCVPCATGIDLVRQETAREKPDSMRSAEAGPLAAFPSGRWSSRTPVVSVRLDLRAAQYLDGLLDDEIDGLEGMPEPEAAEALLIARSIRAQLSRMENSPMEGANFNAVP